MASMALHENARSFAALLKSWRTTRKISQWDLALDASVSQRHLSFLESGRSKPSREMVVQLARALDLPLREQNVMLNAAGFASMYGERRLDEADLDQARHALTVMLEHHEPYPAIVVDRNWNLVLANEANTRLFSRFVDPVNVWQKVGGDAPNLVRVTLHPEGLKPFIVNWEEFVSYFLNHLNHEIATNPANLEARALLDEIRSYPDMPASPLPLTGTRPLMSLELSRDDFKLSLFTMISTFGTPLDVTLQEIRIETFFPADEISRELICSLT